MAKKNYYKILGVSQTATPEELSAAKNLLAKQYHPDVNMKKGIDTTKQMQLILEAYRVLSDPDKRAAYDTKLFGKKSAKKKRSFNIYNMEKLLFQKKFLLLHTGGCRLSLRDHSGKQPALQRTHTCLPPFAAGGSGDSLYLCVKGCPDTGPLLAPGDYELAFIYLE